jgi:hypothetical protein
VDCNGKTLTQIFWATIQAVVIPANTEVMNALHSVEKHQKTDKAFVFLMNCMKRNENATTK